LESTLESTYVFGVSRWHTVADNTSVQGYNRVWFKCGVEAIRPLNNPHNKKFISNGLIAPQPQCATCASAGLAVPVSQISNYDLRNAVYEALVAGRKVYVTKDVV
jgi:hypothetical protein